MLLKQQMSQYLGIYPPNFPNYEKRLQITLVRIKISSDTEAFLKVLKGSTKYSYIYIYLYI